MLNKIFLMGRLTRDPELRYTQSQTAVASFTIAVDRDFSNKESGEKETDFIDIVAWRNTAEFVSKYFAKGRMAVVVGRLQIRPWTDKEGNKRKATEVVADTVYFGDSKKDGDSGAPRQGGYAPGGYQQNGYGAPQYPPQYGSQYDNGYAPPPAAGSYPPSNYGGGFSALTDDDGDLPF